MLSPLSNTLSPLGVSRAPAVPTFSPADVAGLRLWLEADAIEGLADGDPVAMWADASGQGHDFAQATPGARPLYRAGILAGRPVLRFDGVDDWLSGGDLSAAFATAATLFVVAIITNANYSIYTTRPVDGYWRWSGDGHGYFRVFRTARIDGYPVSMPTTGAHLFAVRSGSADYIVWIDGVSQGTQAAGHEGGPDHRIGFEVSTGFFPGDVAAVLAYDSVLADADRTAIEGYLNGKYSLY